MGIFYDYWDQPLLQRALRRESLLRRVVLAGIGKCNRGASFIAERLLQGSEVLLQCIGAEDETLHGKYIGVSVSLHGR